MNPAWVFLVYGFSLSAALLVLFFFRAQSWYWHVISICLGFGVGMLKPPPDLAGPAFDLLIGFFLVFFIAWGAAAPFFRGQHAGLHQEKHA
jgi:hypothetical protein